MNTNRFYAAYGSNMVFQEMAHRCPTAVVVGPGLIQGYALRFAYYADIVERPNAQTPCMVWRIKEEDERAMDVYEAYPDLYKKTTVTVLGADGQFRKAMAYIMVGGRPVSPPAPSYLRRLQRGYRDAGLDPSALEKALAEAEAGR